MKRLLVFSLALITIWSCSKDDDNGSGPVTLTEYEQRVIGTWDLTEVEYDGGYTTPLTPITTPFSGTGENVTGQFVLTFENNVKRIQYNYGFDAKAPSPLGGEQVVPVGRQGVGTWAATPDGSALVITEEDLTTVLLVESNEENTQQFNTTVTETVSIVTAEVDALLTFQRR